MNNDLLGISNVDLGVLKSAFLTPSRDNVLYTDVLSNKEVATYMRDISKLTKNEKLAIITQKMNSIYQGKINDENLLNKEEAYLVLLLKSIPFNKAEADYYWRDRFQSAIHKQTNNVLIEVAAIHPLVDGQPGIEFKEHLEQAIELYNIEKNKQNNPIIYIPGSLHYVIDQETKKPQVDNCPLSEAGKTFLIERGIPEESIRANIINLDIKGEDGVYNSGDECYVATQIAKNENKTLTCYRFSHKYSLIYYGGKPVEYGKDFTPADLKTALDKTDNLVIIPHKAIDEEVESLDYNVIEDGRKYILVERK